MDIRMLDYYFDDALEKPQLHEEPVKECIPHSNLPSENGCFDCNICLDFATDPVVTLCGHLYCWPCIYKWLHVDVESSQQCPVCKAPLSQNSLVPLYGNGNGASKGDSYQSLKIPSRPPARRESMATAAAQTEEQQHAYPLPSMQQWQTGHNPYDIGYMASNTRPMQTRVFHSTAGVVIGDIAISILPRVFRNLEMEVQHARPYPIDANRNSPRLRRQEMQAATLLSQIFGIGCCFVLICLLFF